MAGAEISSSASGFLLFPLIGGFGWILLGLAAFLLFLWRRTEDGVLFRFAAASGLCGLSSLLGALGSNARDLTSLLSGLLLALFLSGLIEAFRRLAFPMGKPAQWAKATLALHLFSLVGLLGSVFLASPLSAGAVIPAALLLGLILQRGTAGRRPLPKEFFTGLRALAAGALILLAVSFLLTSALSLVGLLLAPGWIMIGRGIWGRLQGQSKLANQIPLLEKQQAQYEARESDLSHKTKALSEKVAVLEEQQKQFRANADKAEHELRRLLDFSDALAHLQHSLDYARRIQEALLVSEKSMAEGFAGLFVFSRPRDGVSGDFSWFSQLEDGRRLLCAADCTGHGVPGALMTILGHTLLDEIVNRRKIHRPDQILFMLDRRLRELLGMHHPEAQIQDGMDMALILIHPSGRRLEFAGAGNDLCLVRRGEALRFKGERHGIGGRSRGKPKSFTVENIDLRENDALYLYTDGFQDQLGGPHQRKYMAPRLRNFLVWLSGLPFPDQSRALNQELAQWRGQNRQTDDILVIGLRTF